MNEENYIIVQAAPLREFAENLLQAGGFTPEEAAATAQSLVLSNLLGHDSHGVIRVAEYLRSLKHKEIVSGTDLAILSENEVSCHADGGRGLGQVQMPRLLENLLEKAAAKGMAAGTIRNCGHVGRLGEWAEIIGQRGMAGMVAVNDNGALQIVAPPGGREGRTSTNPVAFGIPLPDSDVFSLDISTSAVAVGKIRLAWISGEQVAENLLQDAQGLPVTDPAVMFNDPKGALFPMGGAQGYKGFGLSMIVDCLAAGLAGGFTPPAPPATPILNNVFVSVWNPEFFAGLSHMQEQAAKYCDHIRQTAPQNPAVPVRVAGDRAKAEKEKRSANGIPLSAGTGRTLAKSAAIVGIGTPEFLKDAGQ